VKFDMFYSTQNVLILPAIFKNALSKKFDSGVPLKSIFSDLKVDFCGQKVDFCGQKVDKNDMAWLANFTA